MFSDESKFNISGCDSSRNVFRQNNTRYDPKHMIFTEKFGGGKSVMVWGALQVEAWVISFFFGKKCNKGGL